MAEELPGDLSDYPPELRSVEALERVVAWLRAMPLPLSMKRRKLYNWAKSVGVTLDQSYYARLEV